jgi:hypothetical protein
LAPGWSFTVRFVYEHGKKLSNMAPFGTVVVTGAEAAQAVFKHKFNDIR